MNSHIKTLSFISGALVISGVVYSLQGCHNDPPVKEPAWVTESKNSNNSQPSQPSTPMVPPATTPAQEVTVAATPPPSKEKRAEEAKKSRQELAFVGPEAVRPMIEVTKGAKKESFDFYVEQGAITLDSSSQRRTSNAMSLSSDPSVLIAEASELLKQESVSHFLESRVAVSPPALVQGALDRAQRALELIKQQSEPDDAELKKQYLNTKLAALAIQAKALGMIASGYDPTRVDAAETAYNEYLAVESDPVKARVAEENFAELLYTSGQWEKAKVAYRRVLRRNPGNTEALARLSGIMRSIANEQESAGQITEAETSSEAADAYSEKLREVRGGSRSYRSAGSVQLRSRSARAAEKTVSDRSSVEPVRATKHAESKPGRIKP